MKLSSAPTLIALAIAAATVGAAHAQQTTLPKELSGRYVVVGTRATQLFSLKDITPDGESAFKAKLTWWTRNAPCDLKDEPIVGRVTATGIAFDAKSCDIPFTVELNRAEKDWVGKGATTGGPARTLELKAE